MAKKPAQLGKDGSKPAGKDGVQTMLDDNPVRWFTGTETPTR